jgi:hypothetical protein
MKSRNVSIPVYEDSRPRGNVAMGSDDVIASLERVLRPLEQELRLNLSFQEGTE